MNSAVFNGKESKLEKGKKMMKNTISHTMYMTRQTWFNNRGYGMGEVIRDNLTNI